MLAQVYLRNLGHKLFGWSEYRARHQQNEKCLKTTCFDAGLLNSYKVAQASLLESRTPKHSNFYLIPLFVLALRIREFWDQTWF